VRLAPALLSLIAAMLRISRQNDCLIVEGRVAGPWVAELQKAAEDRSATAPTSLDLSGVSYVDAAGAALLRTLAAEGLVIRSSSAFISETLKGVAS
jgi:ABC-type transporter Mla MlaB component